MQEKIINIKYQLSASKKKYFLEMKKIDMKFELLHNLTKEIGQSNVHPMAVAESKSINDIQEKLN